MAQIPVKSYGDNTSHAQKINYRLLYYLGNEYSTTDASTSKYAIATGGWSTGSYYDGVSLRYWFFATANNIDITPYISPKWKAFIYRYTWNSMANVDSSYYTNNQFGGGLTGYADRSFAPRYTSQYITSNINVKGFQYQDIIDINQPTTNPARVGIGSDSTFGGYGQKNTNNLGVGIARNGSPFAQLYSYAIGFANIDDITYLSQQGYGNTETDIINSINAPSLITGKTLFNDENAVKYLVKNCTGLLMIAGLNNSTFVTAMRSSPYFNGGTLLGNEHWGRFIALLDY